MKIAIRVILAALLLFGASACGGDGGPRDGGSQTNNESSDDVADITASALALSDLPTGWAEDNSEDDDSSNTLECLRPIESDENNPGLTGRAEVSFMKGANVPALTQQVAQFDEPANAATVATTIDSILDECSTFEEETDDGEPFEGQIGKVSFPDVPGVDGQSSYQLTASTDGINVTAAILVLQVGDYVTLLYWIDLGSFDPDAVLEVATTAVDKLAA